MATLASASTGHHLSLRATWSDRPTIIEDTYSSLPDSWGRARSSSLPPSPSPPLSSIVTEQKHGDRLRSHSVTQLLAESTSAAPGAREQPVHSSTRIVDRLATLLTTLNRERSDDALIPSFSVTKVAPSADELYPPATASALSTAASSSSTATVTLEPRFDAMAYYALALAGPAYYHEQLTLGGGASSSSSYARPAVRHRRTPWALARAARLGSDHHGRDVVKKGKEKAVQGSEGEEDKVPQSASMKIKARYEASLLPTQEDDDVDILSRPLSKSSQATSHSIYPPSFSSVLSIAPSFSSVSAMRPSHTPSFSSYSGPPSLSESSSSSPTTTIMHAVPSSTNRGRHRRISRNDTSKTCNSSNITKLYDQAACYALALAGPVYYQAQCARVGC